MSFVCTKMFWRRILCYWNGQDINFAIPKTWIVTLCVYAINVSNLNKKNFSLCPNKRNEIPKKKSIEHKRLCNSLCVVYKFIFRWIVWFVIKDNKKKKIHKNVQGKHSHFTHKYEKYSTLSVTDGLTIHILYYISSRCFQWSLVCKIVVCTECDTR